MGSLTRASPTPAVSFRALEPEKRRESLRNFLAMAGELRKQYAKHRIGRMLPILQIDGSLSIDNLGILSAVRRRGDAWADRTPRRSPPWILRPPRRILPTGSTARDASRRRCAVALSVSGPLAGRAGPDRRSCSRRACSPPSRSGPRRSTARSTIATCGSRSSSST